MKGDEQCHAHSTCSDLEVVKLWFQFHSSAMANDDSHFSFLGQTNFKPGWWVGVKYDEPFGKNDGRYWTLIFKIFYLCLDLNFSWLHFNEKLYMSAGVVWVKFKNSLIWSLVLSQIMILSLSIKVKGKNNCFSGFWKLFNWCWKKLTIY